MKPPQIFTILALVLLSAFAHAAKTGGKTGGGDEPAPRIAVYLDCSSSMVPYLEAVEAEVRKQFPDADVFKVPGIWVWVDGTVVRGGAASVLPHKPDRAGPRVSLDASRLSPTGKEILARYAGNFEVGSVGAWVDILRTEKRYDALVIFSDFNDQVLQVRPGRPPLQTYVDDAGQRQLPEAEIKDDRTVAEKAWEDVWVGSFDLANAGKAPALYLFSTRNPASRILQKSADISGGKFTLIDWLRPDGPPKPSN
ncbi:MAG: hypothetical protein RLZZ23_125 [Verrucomicrobiota bacterium]|jgi:hypothetical protein